MGRHLIGAQGVAEADAVAPLDDRDKDRGSGETGDCQAAAGPRLNALPPEVTNRSALTVAQRQGRGFPSAACWSAIQASNSAWVMIW
ncbi:MAG: hypothetical protein V3T48_03870 [Vicinamibacterales bacterium]